MGCCRSESKKSKKKNDNARKTKTAKAESKNVKKIVDDPIPVPIIGDNHLPLRQQTVAAAPPTIPHADEEVKPSPWEGDLSSEENISAVSTLDELRSLVRQHGRPVSIVLFYARYCPFSERTAPGLRQWARSNRERIALYEADVEQAPALAEHYHVRTLPTIMAFEQGNLLAPVWQRTADNVPTDANDPAPVPAITESPADQPPAMDALFRGKLDGANNVFVILDPSLKGQSQVLQMIETPNESKQEQYLLLLDTNASVEHPSKLIFAVTNDQHPDEFLKSIDQSRSKKSVASSARSPYFWNGSMASKEEEEDPPSQSASEYHGRPISESTFSAASCRASAKRKRSWNDHLDVTTAETTPQQRIHMSNPHELYYEKQYSDLSERSSVDRLSTLTYPHIKASHARSLNQQEDVCILYFGPNRYRGFEDRLSTEKSPSKLSLFTLKSQSLLE